MIYTWEMEDSQEVIQSLVDSIISLPLVIRACRDDQDGPDEMVIGNVKEALNRPLRVHHCHAASQTFRLKTISKASGQRAGC